MGKRILFPLTSSWMNAAGTLGFVPPSEWPLAEPAAFVTAPITLMPRTTAHPPRLWRVPGGVLIHSGHPNPGWKAVRKRFAPRWASARLPVVVHLLATHTDEVRYLVWELEGLEGVEAVELALPPHCPPLLAEALVQAALGELPLIVQLPRTQALSITDALRDAEVAAFSLAPPRGAARLPDGTLLEGRLYGPAVLPDTLALVRALCTATATPILASGGVYAPEDIDACLQAGAQAVQLDTVLWRGWGSPPTDADGHAA